MPNELYIWIMKKQYKRIYSTQQAADLLSVKIRAIQSRCKNERILRRSNRYVITDEILERWRETYYEDSKVQERTSKDATESNLRVVKDVRDESSVRIGILEEQVQQLYESNQSINKLLTLLNEKIDNI